MSKGLTYQFSLYLCLVALALVAPAAHVLAEPAAQAPAKPAQKIVILWGSIGAGHKTAAEAVAAEVQKKYPGAEVILKDSREFGNKYINAASLWGYDFLTQRWPSLYDKGFTGYMQKGKTMPISEMGMAKSYGTETALRWLHEQEPTLIISTYNPMTEGLIRLRSQGHLKGVPVGWTHTDFVDEEYFRKVAKEIDMTFLAHDALKESWIKAGVPESKLIVTGMAIKKDLFKPLSAQEQSDFLVSKGLDPKVPTITLLGGSAGVGDFVTQVKSLESSFDGPVQIFAMVGKNKRQQKKLEALAKKLRPGITLKIFGWTPQKELLPYQQSSFLVSTKSGGLAPAEVASMNKPMILLDINGGQERYNAEFLTRPGQDMGVATADQTQVGPLARQLWEDPARRQAIVENQIRFGEMTQPGRAADWAVQASDASGVRLSKADAPPVRPSLLATICNFGRLSSKR